MNNLKQFIFGLAFVFIGLSAKAENVILSRSSCENYLQNGFIRSCTQDPTSPNDYTGELTSEGVRFESTQQPESGDIVVTGKRLPRAEDREIPAAQMPGAQSDYAGTIPGASTVPSSNAGASTSFNGTTAQSLSNLYDTQCAPQIQAADRCCQNPTSCIGGGDGSGNQNSIGLGMFQALLGAAGQSAAMSGACGKMRDVGAVTAAMNLTLAQTCSAKINRCKSQCGELANQARAMLESCTSNSSNCGSTYTRDLTSSSNTAFDNDVLSIRTKLRRVANSQSACSENEQYASQQMMQATSSGLTTQLMGLCKEKTEANPTAASDVALNNLNVDCSSAAGASNPACQNKCNRAGAENDPACKNSLGNGFNFGDGNAGLVNPNGKAGLAGSNLDEVEAKQGLLTEATDPVASKVAFGTAGGSAGLPGGDGDGGGSAGGPAGADGGYGSNGLDPYGVSSGIRTGSGYSSSGGRSVASTGGSPMNFGSLLNPTTGKPFNPKDYLPGGRLDPRRRLAGLGAASNQIGAVHGDIFKNITNRFYQVCLRDALMDCETLRKSGRPGN